MSISSPRPRVVVVGGGVLGTSAAAHLVREGADVLLVTEAELAGGASGRSLSWLNSFGNVRSAEYHALRMAGMDRYRTLAARLGPTPHLRFDGGLTWPAPGATEQMRDHHRHMTEIGYDSVWLAPTEVADWTPGVDSAAIAPDGAVFSPGEGWVDLPWLVGLLAGRVRDGGGEILEHRGKVTVRVEGGRAAGVVTATGERFDADAVLLATGPAVPEGLQELGVSVPDATPVALLVKTRPIATDLRAVLNTPHVSLRPTPDGGLAMDSDAAAEEVIGDERSGYEVKDTTVEDLMSHATAILAGHPRLEAEWFGVGRKPIPGDGDPVLGPVEEVPGLSVAFSHSGATLALISGELLAREITTGTASPLLASFRPSRFLGA
jgi:glycine/D-amino acid oxidase-like deaminating enzyme